MSKVLKFVKYLFAKDVAEAVNTLIYNTRTRELVQISYVSDSFLGSSSGCFIVWYNEDE